MKVIKSASEAIRIIIYKNSSVGIISKTHSLDLISKIRA